MDASWTLPELVVEVAARIAALPAPRNGQVRAVPDERTVRYYVTLGLLDRPSAMRGRTALYGRRHAAQVVAIKRLQAAGRSLSEIQALWPTLDDPALARMSGVELPGLGDEGARPAFWRGEPGEGLAGLADPGRLTSPARAAATPPSSDGAPACHPSSQPRPAVASSVVELRVELAPRVTLSLSAADDRVAVSPADVRAIRAAAAPLLAELASRRLAVDLEEKK